ncbi:VRR-NUC domain-containing protein [Sphingomonas sanxanigenens]|uniref:VRR-NUC domain-containing protein n=1 Tax=Sphingomonas sanxanigenens TaxID=397260 RepID=UPI0004AFEB5D|nr:VRR-NUC domain-containing protein [Sphingomonas sanxanigenens]
MTAWYLKKPREHATGAKRRRRKAPGALERPIQRSIIELIETLGLKVAAVPNASKLAGDAANRAKLIAAMKKDGLRPGFPDLIVMGRKPGQIGVLECKREKDGRLSVEQKEWRDFFIEVGHPWACVTSVDEALAAIKSWGWLA